MTVKSKPTNVGDVFISHADRLFNIRSQRITNVAAASTAEQLANMAGYPVAADGTLLIATQEATVSGLIYFSGGLGAMASGEVTAVPYGICDDGPVVINREKLPANDINGVAFTWATIESTLGDRFKFVDEPTLAEEKGP